MGHSNVDVSDVLEELINPTGAALGKINQAKGLAPV